MTKLYRPTARLLVVDDDAVQGAIISNVSRQAGYEAVSARSVEAAINLMLVHSFSCITVDLVLGDRDGIELLRVISELANVPQVIVISGCEERILSSTVRLARSLGIRDIKSLKKPLNLQQLRDTFEPSAKFLPLPINGSRVPLQLEPAQIERALLRHEFYPVFQPKVEISTGRVLGCEALARWKSPELGSVTPDTFIPAMERFNCIKILTLELLDDSLAAAKEIVCQDPAFVIAVNLSADLLSDELLPGEIEALLRKHEVSAGSLLLEVTESVAMADISRAMDILLRFRIKGIGVSMDDFGTGYSSFSVLARMPFNEIKIDRSFVTDCLNDRDLWKIVRGTVALGHEFNMKVVAEGIEDQQTLRALESIGCDIGQGFHFSPALPVQEFITWYANWSRNLRAGDISWSGRC